MKEIDIYRELLIKLHTARWMMNESRVIDILNAISAYAYARTNSNGDNEQDLINQAKTLERLEKI